MAHRAGELDHRPNYKIYSAQEDEVDCAFCKRSSADEGLRERAGPVYIVKLNKKILYMHEYCAIWVPEIYLDDDNKLKSLSEGLERANK